MELRECESVAQAVAELKPIAEAKPITATETASKLARGEGLDPEHMRRLRIGGRIYDVCYSIFIAGEAAHILSVYAVPPELPPKEVADDIATAFFGAGCWREFEPLPSDQPSRKYYAAKRTATGLARGDKVRLRVEGGTWVVGTVALVSGNGLAMAIKVEEGLPVTSCGIDSQTGYQMPLLSWRMNGWQEVGSGERFELGPME